MRAFIYTLFLATLFLLPLAAAVSEEKTPPLRLTPQEREWLKDHPVIRIAIDTSRPPLEYTDNSGNYRGIAADYLALISQQLGIRFEPASDLRWADEAQLLKQKKVDIYPCTVKTGQRDALFTTPYLTFRMVILTDDNVGYLNGADDLLNKTVAVIRGYYPQEILKEHYPT